MIGQSSIDLVRSGRIQIAERWDNDDVACHSYRRCSLINGSNMAGCVRGGFKQHCRGDLGDIAALKVLCDLLRGGLKRQVSDISGGDKGMQFSCLLATGY